MNKDFIRVKALEGELKLSQIKSRFGCSVTTKELIFQKPHHSYQIQLIDIISIIPHEIESKDLIFSPQHSGNTEKVTTSFSSKYFKVSVEKVKVYNRNGIFEKGNTDFIIPLSHKVLDYVAQYSGLLLVT
ncbi:MAG TPA: hypothetical protein VJ824_09440 [Bacillota bacterium]|nr:hypothetical protein [Bacillota bacterium]